LDRDKGPEGNALMVSLCSVYDKLPSDVQRDVARYVVYQLFNRFMENGDYLLALRVAEEAAKKGIITGKEAQILELIPSAVSTLSAAREVAESLVDALKSGSVSEALINTARDVLENLRSAKNELEEAGYSGSLLDALGKATTSLQTLIDYTEAYNRLSNWLSEINKELSNALIDIQEALSNFNNGNFRRAMELMKNAYTELVSLYNTAKNIPSNLDGLEDKAQKISRYVQELAVALLTATNFAATSIHNIDRFYLFLHELESGELLEQHTRKEEIIKEIKQVIMPLMLDPKNLEQIANRVENQILDALRGLGVSNPEQLASSIASILRGLASLEKQLYLDVWKQVAPHNTIIYEGLKEAAESAGVSLPSIKREKLAPLKTAIEWLAAIGDKYAREAGHASGLDKVLDFLASTGFYILAGALSVPLAIPMGIIEHARVIESLLHGSLSKAAREELEILKGFIPPHKNLEQIIAFATILAITLPLMKTRFADIMDIAYPEFRAIGEAVRLARDTLRPEIEAVAKAIPEERVREFVLSYASPGEAVEQLTRMIEEQLREQGVPDNIVRESARSLAREVYKYLLEAKQPSDIEEAIKEAIIRHGLVDLDLALKKMMERIPEIDTEIAEALRDLSRDLLEQLRRTYTELEVKLVENKPVNLAESEYIRLESLDKELEKLNEYLGELKSYEPLLKDILGPVESARFLQELREATRSIDVLRDAIAKAEKIRKAIEAAKSSIEDARKIVSEVEPELAKKINTVSDLVNVYNELVKYILVKGAQLAPQVLDVLRELRGILEKLANEYPKYYGKFAREVRLVDRKIPELTENTVLLRVPEELAKKYDLPLEVTPKNLPEFLERIKELGYPGDAVKLLVEAKNMLDNLRSRLWLLSKIGIEDAGKEYVRISNELRSLEASIKYYETEVKPWRDAVESLATYLDRLGYHDLAARLQEAKTIDEALEAVREAAKKLGARGRRTILDVFVSKLRDLANRLRGVNPAEAKAIDQLINDIEKMLRGAQPGKEVWGWLEAAIHKYKVIRASPEDLARFIEAARRGREELELEIGGRVYRLIREIRVEPNRTEIIYRIEDPEGNYIEYHSAIRVTDKYVTYEDFYKIDPDIRDNPALVETLSRILHDAVSRDPLYDTLRNIVVVTRSGAEPLSAIVTPMPINYSSIVVSTESSKLGSIVPLLVPVPEPEVPDTIREFFENKYPSGVIHYYRIDGAFFVEVPSFANIEKYLKWYRVSINGVSITLPGITINGINVITIPSNVFKVTVQKPSTRYYTVTVPTSTSGGGAPPQKPVVKMQRVPPPPLPVVLSATELGGALGAKAKLRREILVF